MKNWLVVCLSGFSCIAFPLFSSAQNSSRVDEGLGRAQVRRMPQRVSLPVFFEPNGGQMDKRIDLIGRSRGLLVLLTRDAITFAPAAREHGHHVTTNSVAAMHLVGARKLSWKPADRLRGETNYFIGNDPQRWRTHIRHYARADANNVLPGVSLSVYGTGNSVEYDLRFAPGVDPASLKLAISGATDLRVDANGDLLMSVGGNEMRMRKPIVFEELAGATRRRIQGEYVVASNGEVGFRVGRHDPRASVVVDPSLSVAYSSFLGGTGEDSASGIALDSSGNIYVGGTTTSPTAFPETLGISLGPGIPVAGGTNATELFIAKIDPAASGANSLVYLTFLGGSGSQSSGPIAVDGQGNVGIMGTTTSPDFPVTDGSQRTAGTNDVIVSKIDPTGAKLVFSTLFGGSGSESTEGSGGVAFDKSGNIFATFDTSSADLRTTAGAFQTTYGGGTSDGFLAVFQTGGTASLGYGSYFGINATVGLTGLAVDASGAAYVAGFTSNPAGSFPVKNAFQTTYGGDPFDAFLMRLSPLGQGAPDLTWATLLGGGGLDQALAVAVDTASPPNVYVTGTTQSTNFPTNGAVAAYQTAPNPYATQQSASAFLTVVAQGAYGTTPSVTYSTYLGGSQIDAGRALSVSAPNAAYVAGTTTSWDFPWHDNLQPFNGESDAFVTKLDPTTAGAASLIYSTPLGGTSPQGVEGAEANGIAADTSGHVYVAGRTTSADFPTAGHAATGFQQVCGSCQLSPPVGDAFVVEVQESATSEPSVYFSAPMLNFQAPVGTQSPQEEPVLLHNGGEAPLQISSIWIAGPNSADFHLICPPDNCNPAAIAANGTYSLEVEFLPTIVGKERAALSFADNAPAPGSAQELELYGVGLGPLAQVSPSTINFGNVPQGAQSAAQSITLTNVGNETLTIANISEGGQNSDQFSVLVGKTCGLSLPANASCFVAITFSPTASGSFSAEVDFTDDSGDVANSKQAALLYGVGAPPAPIAQILPATASFGTVAVGSIAQAQSITLTNTGSAELNLSSIAITGPNAADFGIVAQGSNSCPAGGGSIAVGGNCTVSAQFSPQSAGAKTASLSFSDNAANSPQTIPLSGTAIAPAIQLSASSLTFQGQNLGTTSASQSVTITNAGSAPLAINGVSISGTNAGDFTQANNCPANLAVSSPGNSCAVQVTFSPSAIGSRTASLSIADNAAGNPHTVALSGSGTQPSVSLTPTSVDFGSWLSGSSIAPVPIVVTNNGTGPLGITKISIGGTSSGDFSETDNCTGQILVGGTCTIQAAFKPSAAGGTNASIAITDNAPNSPQSIALTGTVSDFSLAASASGSTSATVTAGQTATYQLEASSSGSGTVSLSCSGAPAGSTCTASPACVTVTANAAAPFQVSVTTSTNAALPVAPNKPGSHIREEVWRIVLMVLAFATFFVIRTRTRITSPGKQGITLAGIAQSIVILAVLAIYAAACGGGGNDVVQSPSRPGTPAATYSLTITGASGNTSHTLNLSLTVQ